MAILFLPFSTAKPLEIYVTEYHIESIVTNGTYIQKELSIFGVITVKNTVSDDIYDIQFIVNDIEHKLLIGRGVNMWDYPNIKDVNSGNNTPFFSDPRNVHVEAINDTAYKIYVKEVEKRYSEVIFYWINPANLDALAVNVNYSQLKIAEDVINRFQINMTIKNLLNREMNVSAKLTLTNGSKDNDGWDNYIDRTNLTENPELFTGYASEGLTNVTKRELEWKNITLKKNSNATVSFTLYGVPDLTEVEEEKWRWKTQKSADIDIGIFEIFFYANDTLSSNITVSNVKAKGEADIDAFKQHIEDTSNFTEWGVFKNTAGYLTYNLTYIKLWATKWRREFLNPEEEPIEGSVHIEHIQKIIPPGDAYVTNKTVFDASGAPGAIPIILSLIHI